MEPLKRQVRIARRRLRLQQFLQNPGLVLVWNFAARRIVIGVDKFYPLNVVWVGLGRRGSRVGVCSGVDLVWTHRRSELEAALEIDRRFR